MGDLERAVDTVVGRCLGVRADEELLVICDPERVELGNALLEAGLRTGADAVLTVLPPRAERGTEPPEPVAAALAAADVYIAPVIPSLSHTTARKAATERGVRGATMPGATTELVARLMSVDFDAMAERCQAVAQLLTDADEARVTCPRGTDMRFDLRGRS